MRLDEGRYVATNLAGDYLCLSREQLAAFIEKRLPANDRLLNDLEARQFLRRGYDLAPLELLAAQYRTQQSQRRWFTSLHLFVGTLRCDHSCQYCQVSRAHDAAAGYDMTPETADRAVDLMLEGPSPQLKVEFQGGEPLLNFPIVERIVRRTKAQAEGRFVQFVVATNLALLDDGKLKFFSQHGIKVSTSLDGPRELHNRNRPRPGRDAYEATLRGIQRCREQLGHESVSALLTCTADSLRQPEAIVDEYVAQGFRSIFLRHISPYGFAARSQQRIGYETEQFLEFYRRGLARILWHNQQGYPLRETYASILLNRILTTAPPGYVDLLSPTGLGLNCLAYDYDGDVYASDEGRMLAQMGDDSFRLGNVHQTRWRDLFLESELLTIADETMTEGMPGCADCAFQPYCGSDPVFHHVTQGDRVGHRPSSAFCRRNMEIMRHLIRSLEDDACAARILRQWAL
jgi:His-Xaa-Ser system radical SAM maturase HxsB